MSELVELKRPVEKSILMKKMASEQKVTGGDDFLFWREANAIRSAQRIEALNAEFCTFRGECGKFAVELFVKNVFPFPPKDNKTQAALLEEIGFYSEECEVLVEEYVKSAAELCIKKMRLGALVDKCDKQTTLLTEIKTTRKQWNEIWHRFASFREKLSAARKQLLQDSQTENLESGLSNVKFGSDCTVKVRGLMRESFRVLVEMMRGVNQSGQQRVSGLDNAMVLGKRWTDAVVGYCLMKLWVGTFMERYSVYEVLKREIAENWKMEKELKDRIFAHRSEHARVEGGDTMKGEGESSGVVAVVDGDKTVEAKKSDGNSVVEGDKAINEKKSGVGTVLEDEETVEVKKSDGSSLVEGDEGMKEKKSRVGTVLEGEEIVQEKKSEDVALGEGNLGLTKHHVVEGDEAIKEKNETLSNKRRRTSG